jgi:hypothetical protein
VEKLLKRFLLLLTNYCLIEDSGMGLSFAAECKLLCIDKLNKKATWWTFEAFARVCQCILYIRLKITNCGCEIISDTFMGISCLSDTIKSKDKAIPLQAWTGPEGSRRLRLPDLKTRWCGGPPYAPPPPPGIVLGTHFC